MSSLFRKLSTAIFDEEPQSATYSSLPSIAISLIAPNATIVVDSTENAQRSYPIHLQQTAF